jgi:hypothetical protein
MLGVGEEPSPSGRNCLNLLKLPLVGFLFRCDVREACSTGIPLVPPDPT